MKFSRFQTNSTRRRGGFTLIEILVVIGIIGILSAILLPAIFGGLRRAKEFVIQKNVTDLKGALETFKNKFGVYPIDFSIDPALAGGDYPIYQDLVSEFVDRLSSRHQYGNAGYTIFAPGTSLENPWVGAIAGTPATRDPATMSAAEGYVFLLGELSENAEFPLGYVPVDPTNLLTTAWVLDPNRQAKRFYEFKDEKLTDLDLDGWPEFVPESGPKMPICYFDSRTYTLMQRTVMVDADSSGNVDVTELTERLLNFIKIDESDHGQIEGGWCYPYLDFAETAKLGGQYYAFEGLETYQLISAGMDGSYGKGAGAFPGLRYSKNDDAGLIPAHRDNIVSFTEGRMDNDFVTN